MRKKGFLIEIEQVVFQNVSDTITSCFYKHHGASGGKDSLPRMHIAVGGKVRHLTAVECERLQGFPDNWTQIPYRGKPSEVCPDSPRYKAIGNSMATNVMRWIGQRINSRHGTSSR